MCIFSKLMVCILQSKVDIREHVSYNKYKTKTYFFFYKYWYCVRYNEKMQT